MWKMKLKLQNVDKIIAGENKTKHVKVLTFFEVYVFSQQKFSRSMGQFFGSTVTHTLQKNLRSCSWLVYLKFSPGYEIFA